MNIIGLICSCLYLHFSPQTVPLYYLRIERWLVIAAISEMFCNKGKCSSSLVDSPFTCFPPFLLYIHSEPLMEHSVRGSFVWKDLIKPCVG